MDPLSLIGGIQATTTIVTGTLYTIQKLYELRAKYKQADNTIRILANELLAVSAAVRQIEGWYEFEIAPESNSKCDWDKIEREPPPEEMVEAFKVTFEGCRESMDALREELDDLTSKNPFLKRVSVIWNETSMKEHVQMLRHQVGSLQLLTQAVRLTTGTQQATLLRLPQNRKIIEKVADDTSTLRASRRGSRYGDGDTATVTSRSETVLAVEPASTPTRVDRNPFRMSQLQLDIQLKRQSTNPFLNRSASAATSKGTTTYTSDMSSIFDSQADSGFNDSGFYDEDADIVQSSYRERTQGLKVETAPSVQRSISAPSTRGRSTPTPIPTSRNPKVQFSPMERFHVERHNTNPIDYDPIESHLIPSIRKHSTSDSIVQQLQTPKSPETKRSPWGTLKRLRTRKQSDTQSSGAGAHGSTLKPGRSVKRKSESNIHQSIDFGSEDGLQTPLIVRAAQSASRVEIAQLVEQRVDIEATHTRTGRTALAVASHCGNDEVVAILLHHRANTEAKDHEGMTPLHLASSRGHYRVVKQLLEYHANVDAQESINNRTPLRFACDGGYRECCELLIEHRAKVTIRDKKFFTALHAAAKIGDVEILELLIKNGADFEAKDARLMTAMHYAAQGDFDHVVDKLIFYKANIESSGEKGMSPLSCACASGAYQTAKLLISKKANFRHKADGDMTPLHFAAMNDHDDMADLILQQRKVAIDARNSEHRTPLHLAIIEQKFATTELLLRKAASLEATCNRSLRPLHYACEKGNEAIVQLLLGYGAQLEVTTNLGWRPIHFAAYKGSVPITKVLIQKGVDKDAYIPDGDRALCMACSYGHVSLVKYLLEVGCMLRKRVAKGPSLEDNPMCRAARHGHLNVVDELIAYGASVSERDEKNWSPLRYAVHFGWPDIVEVLLLAGAPPSDEIDSNTGIPSPASSSWGFADKVSQSEKEEIWQLLKVAEASLVQRRINESGRDDGINDTQTAVSTAYGTAHESFGAFANELPVRMRSTESPEFVYELSG